METVIAVLLILIALELWQILRQLGDIWERLGKLLDASNEHSMGRHVLGILELLRDERNRVNPNWAAEPPDDGEDTE